MESTILSSKDIDTRDNFETEPYNTTTVAKTSSSFDSKLTTGTSEITTEIIVDSSHDLLYTDTADSYETELTSPMKKTYTIDTLKMVTSETTTEFTVDSSKDLIYTDTANSFETEFTSGTKETSSIDKTTIGISEITSEIVADISKELEMDTENSLTTQSTAAVKSSFVNKATTGLSEITTCASEFSADATYTIYKDPHYPDEVQSFETEPISSIKGSGSYSKITAGTSEGSTYATMASSKDRTYTVYSFESESVVFPKDTCGSVSKITADSSQLYTEPISSKDLDYTEVNRVDMLDNEVRVVGKQSSMVTDIEIGMSEISAEPSADSCTYSAVQRVHSFEVESPVVPKQRSSLKKVIMDGDGVNTVSSADLDKELSLVAAKKEKSVSKVTFADTFDESSKDLEVSTADGIETESTDDAENSISFDQSTVGDELIKDTIISGTNLGYAESHIEPTDVLAQSNSGGKDEIAAEATQESINYPHIDRGETFETKHRVFITKKGSASKLPMDRNEVDSDPTENFVKNIDLESLETTVDAIKRRSGSDEVSKDTATESSDNLNVVILSESDTESTGVTMQSSSTSKVQVATELIKDSIKHPQTDRGEMFEIKHRVFITKKGVSKLKEDRNAESTDLNPKFIKNLSLDIEIRSEAESTVDAKMEKSVSKVTFAERIDDSTKDIEVGRPDFVETESATVMEKHISVDNIRPCSDKVSNDTTAVYGTDLDHTDVDTVDESRTGSTEVPVQSSSASEVEIPAESIKDSMNYPQVDRGETFKTEHREFITKHSSVSKLQVDRNELTTPPTANLIKNVDLDEVSLEKESSKEAGVDRTESIDSEPIAPATKSISDRRITAGMCEISSKDLEYTVAGMEDSFETKSMSIPKQSSSVSNVEMSMNEVVAETTKDYVEYPHIDREERFQTETRVFLEKRSSVSKITDPTAKMSISVSEVTTDGGEVIAETTVISEADIEGISRIEHTVVPKESSSASKIEMDMDEETAEPTNDCIKYAAIDREERFETENRMLTKKDRNETITEFTASSVKHAEADTQDSVLGKSTAGLKAASGDSAAVSGKGPYHGDTCTHPVNTVETDVNRLDKVEVEPAIIREEGTCVSRVKMGRNELSLNTMVVDLGVEEKSDAKIDTDSDAVSSEIIDQQPNRVTSSQEQVLEVTVKVKVNAASADTGAISAIADMNETKMDASGIDSELKADEAEIDGQAVDAAPEYSSPDVWPQVNEAAYAMSSAPGSREEQREREKALSSEQSVRIPTSISVSKSNGKESEHESVVRKMLDDKNVQSPAPPPPSPELKGLKKSGADITQARSHESLAMEPLYEETGEIVDALTSAPDAVATMEEDPGVMTHVSHVAPLGQSQKVTEMTDQSFVNVDIPADVPADSDKTNGDGTVRSSNKSDTDGTTFRSNIPSSAGVSGAGYTTERTLTGELASDECEDSSPDPQVKGTVPVSKTSYENVSKDVLPEAPEHVGLEDSQSTTDTENIMEPRPCNAPRENASQESELIMAEGDIIRTSTDMSVRNDVSEDEDRKQFQDSDVVDMDPSQPKPVKESVVTSEQEAEKIAEDDSKEKIEVEEGEAEKKEQTVEETT